MKYKLLVIAATLFTVCGYFAGTLTNSDPNDTLAVAILAVTNVFFIAMMLTAFKMLSKKSIEDRVKGYTEGTKDIVKGVDKVYGSKGVDKVLSASKKIITGYGGKKPHVHNHSHY
jgi:hypothetical protein